MKDIDKRRSVNMQDAGTAASRDGGISRDVDVRNDRGASQGLVVARLMPARIQVAARAMLSRFRRNGRYGLMVSKPLGSPWFRNSLSYRQIKCSNGRFAAQNQ